MTESIQHGALLRECRLVMTGRLRRTISAVLRELNDALYARGLNSYSDGRKQQSTDFDAVRELQLRKGEIELRFENRFAELFERRAGFQGAARQGVPSTGRQQDDAGDEPVFIQPAVKARIRESCRSSLLELDKRIGVLLRDPNLNERENPLTPDIVFDAFGSVCADVDSGDEVRRVLLEIFANHLCIDLPEVYRDVNNLLVRRGVLPGLSFFGRGSVPQAGGRGNLVPLPVRKKRPAAHVAVDSVRTIVISRIHDQIGSRRLPRFVQSFLDQQWCSVLEKIHREHGEASHEWRGAMETVADLINHLRSFSTAEDRRKAIWMLPGLVFRMKRGMQRAGIPLHEQLIFLKTLRAYHLRLLGQRAVVDD